MKKTKLIAFVMVLAVMASSIYAKPKKTKKSKETVPGTAKTAGWTLNTDKPIKFDWYIKKKLVQTLTLLFLPETKQKNSTQ